MLGSITVTNHTDKTIELRTTKDNSAEVEKYTIAPKDYFVFMADRIDSLHWVKLGEANAKS